jgi:anthranilate phosphoribosyltransferase
MKEMLHPLLAGRDLSQAQAHAFFEGVMTGMIDPVSVGAVLTALAMKGPSIDELVAAAQVMRAKSVRIELPDPQDLLDTCGTGGDVKGTFNISTATAIVLAACGVRVVKHGNRSASSKSGSADVLEALGVRLDLDPAVQQRCLREAGICFAFARNHHPAMKHVAAIRQSLGITTIFNLLGPLTNPAGARRQLLGVYADPIRHLLASALKQLGVDRAAVVHAEDGLDELSTMSPTRVTEIVGGEAREYLIEPTDFGLPRGRLDDLRVNSPAESAAAIRDVLSGKPGPRAEIVMLNAAMGLVVAGRADSMIAALAQARAVLGGGVANATLERLVRASNEPSAVVG